MPSTLYKVELQFTLSTGEAGVCGHFIEDPSGSTTLGQALTAAELYMSTLAGAAGFTAVFPDSITFTGVGVSEVNIATGVVIATAQGGTSFPGGDVNNEVIPPQCAIAVSLRTGLASRSDRGRYFLPSPSFLVLTAVGRLDPTAATALVNAVASAHNAEQLSGPGNNLVVYSRLHKSTSDVNQVQVGDVVDTQRRRRDGLSEARMVAAV